MLELVWKGAEPPHSEHLGEGMSSGDAGSGDAGSGDRMTGVQGACFLSDQLIGWYQVMKEF